MDLKSPHAFINALNLLEHSGNGEILDTKSLTDIPTHTVLHNCLKCLNKEKENKDVNINKTLALIRRPKASAICYNSKLR